MASLTLRFVSAKRLFRDLSESNSKLVEHRAQSPVREFMLAVWPSITEGFPNDVHVIYTINVTNTCAIVCGKSIIVNYYFQVSVNLKVILYVAKISQHSLIEYHFKYKCFTHKFSNYLKLNLESVFGMSKQHSDCWFDYGLCK